MADPWRFPLVGGGLALGELHEMRTAESRDGGCAAGFARAEGIVPIGPAAREKMQAELDFRASGKERRYSWDYDEQFDIYAHDLQTGERINLTNTLGYDAEGAYSPDGSQIVFASNRRAYQEVIGHLADQGAQGVILGCTEIGLLIKNGDSPIPFFDTTGIHAEAAVAYALGASNK